MTKKRTKPVAVVELSEVELFLISDALAAYQKSLEQAVYLSWDSLTSPQRRALADRGAEAVTLRGRLHSRWNKAGRTP